MERLTNSDKIGAFLVKCRQKPCEGLRGKCGSCAYMQEAIEKLAEYEDLGITADQMKEIDELYKQRCEDINRLKEET